MTPWKSWITCEETGGGRVVQTDLYGSKEQNVTTWGDRGWYESFECDDGTTIPACYVTRDTEDGVVTRFTPDDAAYECYLKPNDHDPWCTHNSGIIDQLFLSSSGNVEWIADYDRASQNARELYPNGDGMDVSNGILYLTSKKRKQVTVNFRIQKCRISSMKSGAFHDRPDQIAYTLIRPNSALLLFCADGGLDA